MTERARATITLIVGLLIALLVLLVAGCCGLSEQALEEVRRGQRGAKAIADDASLDSRSRAVGLACYDFSWAVLYSAGEVKELPSDVRARVEARRVAREGRAGRLSLSGHDWADDE